MSDTQTKKFGLPLLSGIFAICAVIVTGIYIYLMHGNISNAYLYCTLGLILAVVLLLIFAFTLPRKNISWLILPSALCVNIVYIDSS